MAGGKGEELGRSPMWEFLSVMIGMRSSKLETGISDLIIAYGKFT